ncbi:hypothetical protein JIN85_15800 [Luteolibacter pohnpeiensis]|uniref:Uncharacterized protein n=1 Tax=Luteolibacter pohnpeiensis TaxID=454153 RepID=A0A934VVS8_9BACT|nr:hypothetical protein [Luteolibacter pohnpeiensis]MBK1883882.1 hypothetical protein [Luteolibacter pohnpeiensis]
MKLKSILLTVAALATCATAQAGTRTRVVTGPQGNTATRTVQTSGCAGYQATRTVVRTGPNGNSVVKTQTVTTAPHAAVTVVAGPAPVRCAPAVAVYPRRVVFVATPVPRPCPPAAVVVRVR